MRTASEISIKVQNIIIDWCDRFDLDKDDFLKGKGGATLKRIIPELKEFDAGPVDAALRLPTLKGRKPKAAKSTTAGNEDDGETTDDDRQNVENVDAASTNDSSPSASSSTTKEGLNTIPSRRVHLSRVVNRLNKKSSSLRASNNKNKKKLLPRESVEYLKNWMMSPEHIAHPYPTEQEKAEIMAETGIGMKQLTNWFANNRTRFWKPHVANKKVSSGSMKRRGPKPQQVTSSSSSNDEESTGGGGGGEDWEPELEEEEEQEGIPEEQEDLQFGEAFDNNGGGMIANEEVLTLRKENEYLRRKNSELSEKNSELSRGILYDKHKLGDDVEDELMHFKESCSVLEVNLEQAQNKVHEQETTIENLNDEIDELRVALEDEKNDHDQLKSDHSVLDDEYDKLFFYDKLAERKDTKSRRLPTTSRQSW